MSYRGDGPGAPYGPSGTGPQQDGELQKGSVKAARERLQTERERRERRQREEDAEILNNRPHVRDNTSASQYLPPSMPRQPQPTASGPRRFPVNSNTPQPPSAPQQWPLPTSGPSSQSPMTSRGMLPSQRPQPPLNPTPVITPPTFLDTTGDATPTSRLQPPQIAYWQDDDYLSPTYGSPNLSRPLTNSSLTSDSSSIGTIPDFPVPSAQVPLPVRRNNQFIGPPPSARRGPSSYYSQISYVSPIAEESSDVRASVGSFASSNVFPMEERDFYLEDASDDEGAATRTNPSTREPLAGSPPNGGDTNAEVPNTGLVRQASLGKRTKPKLTTIKSGEAVRSALPSNAQAAIAGAQSHQDFENANYGAARSQMASPLANGSVLLDASSSSSSSEESLHKPAVRSKPSADSLNMKEFLTAGKPRTPLTPSIHSPSIRTAPSSPLVPEDLRVDHILGGLERGGALSPAGSREFREAKKGSLADRIGSRRPPRLDVDAVRDAEARGSLTSLPDLIKRATRLAANLDRGKTASRLGFEWLDYEKGNGSREFNSTRSKARRSTRFSGMLSAFPPPAGSAPGSPRTHWPTSGTGSAKSLNPREKRRGKEGGRRCCGLRPWSMFFLAAFFLVLIIVAIVVPLVLIVLPKRNVTSAASAGSTAVCQSKTTCQNGGGGVIMSDGTCGCLCTNGFTGPQCQTPSDAGCSTMNVAGVKDASVGSQIPPLIDAAASNYSIPLDAATLLTLFATTNMTCGTENAIVTLSGSTASKRSDSLLKRADTQPSSPTLTSNGIAVAGTTPTQTTSVSSSTTSAIAIATGSAAPGTNTTSRDFGRIGILFVLQESRSLQVAIGAQEVLSDYMDSAAKQGSSMTLAHNVTLGAGYFIDLWYWTVTLANGTVYGNGFNGSATTLNLPGGVQGSA
jgi:hypothetical protein